MNAPSFADISNLELPAYVSVAQNTNSPSTTRRHRVKHVFVLADKKKPWVTVTLNSSASSPGDTPVVIQGERITGSVQFHLEKVESIREISVHVRILRDYARRLTPCTRTAQRSCYRRER